MDSSYVLLARLSVELFHALPPFERLLFCEFRMFLEQSSSPDSNCWRFIKTVRVLADITTRQSIAQVYALPLKSAHFIKHMLRERERKEYQSNDFFSAARANLSGNTHNPKT